MINLRIVREMEFVGQGLERYMDQLLNGPRVRVCGLGPVWCPQVDVYELPDAFVAVSELAGVKTEDIEIQVDRLHLKINGMRRSPKTGSSRVIQTEISHGRFSRAFRLPGPIDPERVTAGIEDGLLRVILPKLHISGTGSASTRKAGGK
jgi:HSP20 family protein